MPDLVRRLRFKGDDRPAGSLPRREWLVANGLGGFASGTVAGPVTRRYHGLLIAALPAPLGRSVMLTTVTERLRLADGTEAALGHEIRSAEDLERAADEPLVEFRLDEHLPVWRYEVGDAAIEKRVVMPHGQNIVHVTYRLVGGSGPVTLMLRPLLQFRPIEAPVGAPADQPYVLSAAGRRYEVSAGADLPALRLKLDGGFRSLTLDGDGWRETFYGLEAERGYDSRGPLWSPGHFTGEIAPGRDLTLIAGTEPWHVIEALTPDEAFDFERERRRRLVGLAPAAARQAPAADLVLAADSFLFKPVGRVADIARARAAGDELRSVIAGYHWFTDWGRDTMISLEGLTLVTNRPIEARWILRTFAHYVRDGLIPNMFPEGKKQGLYNTADATLWFFHAVDRFVAATGDRDTLRGILPMLRDIVHHHRAGTRFGIGVDGADGLLRQGAEGYQLTWMDAKVDGWVVTPRRGKAVEINALWYNALRLLEGWLREEHGEAAARPAAELAEQARDSFNNRFWYAEGGYLYDVIDGEHGDDPACRPNQIFAVALPHAVLDEARWAPVVETVRGRLLTPVGLRSLAPGHPDYKPRYFGDLRARDAAYHQGTVWAWLIGPFVDAWLKLHPDDRVGARSFLDGFGPQLDEACIGSISEIFDAEPPFTPRGCVSQAWSVAEVLRAWVKTAPPEE
jgi:predicted glycogen debranching enzyme